MFRAGAGRILLCGANSTSSLRRGEGVGRLTKRAQRKLDKLKQQTHYEKLQEENSPNGIAQFPHKVLMQSPVPPVSVDALQKPSFTVNVTKLKALGTKSCAMTLSAPKMHWGAQVVLIDSGVTGGHEFDVMVNPEAPGYDDPHAVVPMYGMWESCASCVNMAAWVIRPQKIHIHYLNEYGDEKKELLTGIRARMIMHELDHLKGRCMLQKAVGPEFITSTASLRQKDLWPPGFPSMEAAQTDVYQMFDYVTNQVIIAPGMERFLMNKMNMFTEERLQH